MAITKDRIVNDVIREEPKTIGVFTRFNIDSCCGGAASIEAAAKRDNVDLDALLQALNSVK